MLRIFFVLIPLVLSAFDLDTCRSCHPTIVKEFEASAHARSSAKRDPFFAAMLRRSPEKRSCRNCHAPEMKSAEGDQGMTCLSCHRIEKIEKHAEANRNLYRTAKDKTLFSAEKGREDQVVKYHIEKSWFGLSSKKVGSPYHDLDYRNPIYYSGELCMGCHSHKVNGHGLDLCRMGEKGVDAKGKNCIRCHMPQAEGSATTIRQSDTHAWHGAAGLHQGSQRLSRYIGLSIQPTERGFQVTLKNKSPHPLLTHPARVLELHTTVFRDGEEIGLPTRYLRRVLGKDGKPTAPWLADRELKNTIPDANSSSVLSFDFPLQSGDRVETVLGARLLAPKLANKLGLDPKEASFIELKRGFREIGSSGDAQ